MPWNGLNRGRPAARKPVRKHLTRLKRHGVKRFACERCTPGKATTLFVWALAFFLLVVVDLFGLEEETRKMSQDITTRVMAPFYPPEPSDVLVILFDNTYLQTGGTWPASFNDHTLLVNRLASLEPQSILYDIIFAKRNGNHDASALAATIERTQDRGIPFYYPKDVNEVALGEIGAVSRQVMTQWDNEGVFYPPAHAGMATPAFKIYTDSLRPNDAPESRERDLSQWSDMFVYWGAREAHEERSLTAKLWDALANLFPAFYTPQPRPYIRSVTYSEFFSTNDRDKLHELVSGKHVIVGTSIDGVEDYVVNAVDGQTPGVFLHATALDNLVKFGSEYFRDGDEIGWSFLPVPLFLEILAIISLIAMWQWVNCTTTKSSRYQRMTPAQQRRHRFNHLIVPSILSLVVLTFLFWVINGYLRSDPGNVIGLLSIDLPILALTGLAIERVIAKILPDETTVS